MPLLPRKNPRRIFFLCGMPRSGNTLFTSIMNQNPDIAVTPNSPTLEIIKDINRLKQTDIFQNFPDEVSLNNVIKEIFNLYYKNWNYSVIIDRTPIGTSENLKVFHEYFDQPIYCIVLIRDIVDVLASYIKWFETEPTSFVNRFNLRTIEDKLSKIMNVQGEVAQQLISIQYFLKHKEQALFIDYDNLVKNPKKEIKRVYKFLNLPYFKHHFVNLDQVVLNGVAYNDSVLGNNMHSIRTDKIMKVKNIYKKLVPEKYKRKNYGTTNS
jgi:hypothetical protein